MLSWYFKMATLGGAKAQAPAHLGLLCHQVARSPDAVCKAQVPARHDRARHARLSLADADIVQKVVAVHEGQVLPWKEAGARLASFGGSGESVSRVTGATLRRP